jgi:hypothetical protein
VSPDEASAVVIAAINASGSHGTGRTAAWLPVADIASVVAVAAAASPNFLPDILTLPNRV